MNVSYARCVWSVVVLLSIFHLMLSGGQAVAKDVKGLSAADGAQVDITIKMISPAPDGGAVSRPLPVSVDGVIEGFVNLPAQTRNKLHLYIAQRSQDEVIFHIQPELIVDSNGRFSGRMWLGSERYGNNSDFEVHFILTTANIPLLAGDNPVRELPPYVYGQKHIVRRID